MCILVVDDNLANREVARHILSIEGLEPIAVENAYEAIDLRKDQVFDAVLMDIQMPGMCGLECTLILRAMEGLDERCPIFALTAFHGPGDRAYCDEMGLDGILTKPFQFSLFREMLESWNPPSTLDPDVLGHLLESKGESIALRIYAGVLSDILSVSQDASPDMFREASLKADSVGLSVLAERCRIGQHAPTRWRTTCVNMVQRECQNVVTALRRARVSSWREAAPSPGTGALRA